MLGTDDIQIYEGRTLGDVLKDIDERSRTKRSRIEGLIDRLVDMVDNPDNAIVLVPLIKEYMDIDNTNDKHLIELAKIVEKLYKTSVNRDGSAGIGDLSSSEKDWLREVSRQEEGDEDDDDLYEDGEPPPDPRLDALSARAEAAMKKVSSGGHSEEG